jgi:hypothetical protein
MRSRAAAVVTGPRSLPGTIFAARSRTAWMTWSTSPTASSTLAAMQRWPAQPVKLATTFSAVSSSSASGTTIRWFFAPPRQSARLPCVQARP